MCDAMSEYYDCLRTDDDAFVASLLKLSLACVCVFFLVTRGKMLTTKKNWHMQCTIFCPNS